MEIKLSSDTILQLGDIPVSNAVLASYLVSILIVIGAYFIGKNVQLVPGRVQLLFEMIIGYFYNEAKAAFHDESDARRFAPYILTLFFLILVLNLFPLLPLFSQVVVGEENHYIHVFKVATSDWSFTLAMAMATILGAHIFAFSVSPLKHIGNYLRFGALFKIKNVSEIPSALIGIFIGFLEILGDIAKTISLSARLFGNIFAGEVMYVIVIGLSVYTQFVFPMPLVLLSIVVGLIQAFVFSFLSLQFMATTVGGIRTSHH